MKEHMQTKIVITTKVTIVLIISICGFFSKTVSKLNTSLLYSFCVFNLSVFIMNAKIVFINNFLGKKHFF